MDVIISSISLLLTLIITIPTVLALLIANSGTPFFFQHRPGKNGKLFRIVKFKTMNDRRDRMGNLLPDEVRLTTIGKIVRKLSIDELPQLVNVLKGDMSLIGPRPLLVKYLDYYTQEEKKRHNIRPGITGWAQINGRNNLEWNKRLAMDVWYVDNYNFKLDINIVIQTVVNIIKRKDIATSPSKIMKDLDNERSSRICSSKY